MDTEETHVKAERLLGGKVLQKQRFGRSGHQAFWVEMKNIARVAESLKADEALRLDWLENLSVMQVEDNLVFTYFLRSRTGSTTVVLRGSLELKGTNDLIEVPSVSEVWPAAAAMEREQGALFGVEFGGKRPLERGFPLRKGYAW